MLDSGANQGFSLRSLTQETAPHLVAMASHGDQTAELPLLWDLCSTYVRLGYSVAVLDATTVESDSNPGLEQLLDYAHWRSDTSSDQAAWSVLPAANGFNRMCAAASHLPEARDQLAGAFQNYNLVLVYASADILLSLLPNSGLKPLLLVSTEGLSRLTAYKALKRMVLNGRLHPTIVSVVPNSALAASQASLDLCKNLQECAMTFLGHHLDTVTLQLERTQGRVQSRSMQTFALRMLEGATPLQRYIPARFGSAIEGGAMGEVARRIGVH